MKVEVFGKKSCAVCQSIKRKLSHLIGKWGYGQKVDMVFVDVETVEGLAEGAFNDVSEVPTTIISEKGDALGRWEGEVPRSEEIRKAFAGCRLNPSG